MKLNSMATSHSNLQSASHGGIQISLLAGDAAHSWVDNETNVASWRSLYAKCPWSTSFQKPDFFRVWFRHYGARWCPVLVLGFDDHGSLAALIALAAADGVVTGVGAHQAEYHGWLSGGDCPSDFLKDAVAEILKNFPRHDLRLRYLPPGVPMQAVKELHDGDRRSFVHTHPRHLLALDEAAINETLRKKGNRSKINRLKRLGPFAIRKMEPEEFAQCVDEISAMCDFRQGAVNDSCPFKDDPKKRAFHLDWVRTMSRDVIVSGMFVNGAIVSTLIFALSKREAHIAITAHSPEHAENSPGKIHIYEAALTLAREGFSLIDMTPGGDDWKIRFATRTDEVVDLTVFANSRSAALQRVRRAIGSTARSAAARAGISTSRIKQFLRSVGEVGRWHKKVRADVTKSEREIDTYYLAMLGSSHDLAETIEVRVNALPDLLRFGPQVMRQGRQAFLRQALARMESGDRCYSLSGPRGIVGIGWSAVDRDHPIRSAGGSPAGADKPSVRLFDFSVETRSDARHIYATIIRRILSDMKSETTVAGARVSVPVPDSDLRFVVESLGFQRDLR